MNAETGKTVRRIIGVVILVVAVIGVILSVAGTAVGWYAVDQTAVKLDEVLVLASRTLDAFEETLLETQTMLTNASAGLETMVQTADDTEDLLGTTGSMLDLVSQTVGEDIPAGIDSVQEMFSDVAEAARGIDEAMKALSDIAGLLGIDLNVTTSLEASLSDIGLMLNNLSRDIRALGKGMAQASANLGALESDTQAMTAVFATLSEDLMRFSSSVDEYLTIVRDARDSLSAMQAGIPDQARTAKLIITILMIWFGLAQIAPLYLGWELVAGRRDIAPADAA